MFAFSQKHWPYDDCSKSCSLTDASVHKAAPYLFCGECEKHFALFI